MNTYILTISCEDRAGIVATVTSFLHKEGGFVIESAQFGDFSTNKFFMRCEFKIELPQKLLEQKFTEEVATKFNMDFNIYNKDYKMKTLIMVSKFGHCLNDLLHRTLPMDIVGVVSNHTDYQRLTEWNDIPFHYLPITKETKQKQEAEILKIIEEQEVELIILARYMQVLSPELCNKMSGKIINIHHSFLPSFKGAKPYQQAYDKGVKIIGATAHFVTSALDEGPIIEQEINRVNHSYKPQELAEVGQDIESVVLARAVKYHLEHRVLLNDNKTVVFK